MTDAFKPMLAAPADLDSLRYPLLASPKLDGVRAIVKDGRLVSRKLLDIPNVYIREAILKHGFSVDGLDGELIVGDPTDKDVYNRTVSYVMSAHKKPPSFTFFVFDTLKLLHHTFDLRYMHVERYAPGGCVRPHLHVKVDTRRELERYEERVVEMGYEGVILRSLDGPYKFGRSTAKEQFMLKVKRFEDSEFELVGIEEEMHNTNEAGKDELGRTKRSTAKAGLVGKGTMGALVAKDLKTGVVFNIGTGFTAEQRAQRWDLGSIHKYKFFPVGVKDKPRHPVYIGPRDARDL